MRAIVLASTALALTAPAIAAPPVPSFTIVDATASEEAGTITFTIKKHGKLNGLPSILNFYTVDGAAKWMQDFDVMNTSVNFTAAETVKTVTFKLINDALPEPTEMFTGKIRAVSNARLYDGTALGTITDNDVAPPSPPPVDCPDGSQVPAGETCPEPPPPPPPVQCPDGSVLPAGSTCPDLPPPPIGSVDIPSPSLKGLELVAPHDFALDLQPAWGTGQIPPDNGTDSVGAYRQVCAQGHLSNDDHVLYPRQPGKAHLHDFSGNKTTNANSTSETLVGKQSTCNETLAPHASQSAAYWITAAMNADGTVLRPDHNTVYYKALPSTNPLCGFPSAALTNPKVGVCIPFPNGLKMIAGSLLVPGQPDKKGPLNIRPTAHAYISCFGTGSKSGAYMNFDAARLASPICPDVHFIVEFPTCWDGKNLWKVDRSHVVYPYDPHTHGKKICPASNPYLITGVTIHYKYTPTPAQWAAGLGFSSDTVDPTLPKGWSGHADADLTWNTPVKDIAMAKCVEAHKNCSGGDIGDGRQLKGAAQPYYINPVTGKYEPRWENPLDTIPVPEGLTIAGSAHSH